MWTCCALLLLLVASPQYRKSIETWRAEREARLKADDGWLTLTGLFWLQEGDNPVGSASGNRIRLPAGLPSSAGTFIKRDRSVAWQPAGGSPQKLNSDKSGNPDVVQIGQLTFHVIERGTKFGIRMKDKASLYRRNFAGLSWFPADEEWVVKARFVAQPKQILFDAQAGDKQQMSSPGYVEWNFRGRAFRLTPVTEENQLFFVFRDLTAGKTTYSAARFLYADHPKNGYVTLDFNKAYNPPCVFTPYATCPLPPPENRLPIAVQAGEKMYSGH